MMIKTEKLTKKYGDFTAVNHVDLQVQAGEFLGLLGPNGAGKTTLIRMLVGLAKASAGKIYINGQIMGRNKGDLKGMIGIVPQHINLDKELTVRENLLFCAKLFKLPKEQREKRAEELLEFVGLKNVEKRESQKLSGGMQRKLMIAKALINDPHILYLDEPTVGIDLTARRKIWDILKTMKNKGKTIMLTTHYIEEAEYLCDKVALMDEGKIFYCDTPDNLKIKLGKFTLEYFNDNNETEYRYFKSLEQAKQEAGILENEYTLRKTSLEDVFYNFTNRKVN